MNLPDIPAVGNGLIGLARTAAARVTIALLDNAMEHQGSTEDEDEGCDNPDHDHSRDNVPLMPWQSGRIGLELVMLIRSHRDFPQGHHEAVGEAVSEMDSPQHAADIVMAVASMLAHIIDDEEIEMFGQSLMEAEARSS